MDKARLIGELLSYTGGYGIDLSCEEASLLVQHLSYVLTANREINLTRITDPEEALVLHVLDSLLLVPVLNELTLVDSARFVDIGTGAGFPGIPFGIASGLPGLLIDSVGKKIHVVEQALSVLSLTAQMQARSIRSEDLAREQPRAFDLVVSRAVADTSVLIEYATPLLSDCGYLLVSKSRPSVAEIAHAAQVADQCGFESVSRETFELPQRSGHREILVYRKASETSITLPRRNGMAVKRPL